MAGYDIEVLSNNLEYLVVWYLLGPMGAGLTLRRRTTYIYVAL